MNLIKMELKKEQIRSLLLTSLLVFSPTILLGNPTQNDVSQINGDISFGGSPKHLSITAGDGALIDWKNFSIGRGESTTFIQPNSSSTVINRVTGDKITGIDGQLLANGRVILINPNGIWIGKEGFVKTAGFIASTLGMENQLSSDDKTLKFKGDSKNSVVNLGTVETAHGDIFLLGFQVKNSGNLSAPEGTVGLGAGSEVLIKPTGFGERLFIKTGPEIEPSKRKKGAAIEHSGKIKALKAELKADGNPFKFAIQSKGLIEATGVLEQDGFVYLVGDNGLVSVSGEIIAQAPEGAGGSIYIFGDKVELIDKAVIDASGDSAGGNILIGGAFQGINSPYKNAREVTVADKVLLNVRANKFGNGGEAIIWSDAATTFTGKLMGEGGEYGGNGAFVEISGKEKLKYTGTCFLLAHGRGAHGNLLLDPTTIHIVSGPVSTKQNPFFIADDQTDPVIITSSTIMQQLFQGGVTISTAGGVGSEEADIWIDSNISWVTNNPLSLHAHRDIHINGVITNTQAFSGANLSVNAGRNVNISKSISLGNNSGNGGSLIKAGNDVNITATTAPIFSDANVDAGGSINITGGNTAGAYAVLGNPTNPVNKTICVSAVGDLNITGGSAQGAYAAITRLGVNAPITGNVSGDITATVGGNITLTGGSQPLAQAYIGHGGFSTATSTLTVSGAVNVNAIGNIELVSGGAAEAFIGTAANYSTSQEIAINAGGNLYMHHSTPIGGAPLFIGASNGPHGTSIDQSLNLTVGKNLTLDARNGGATTLQPMKNGSLVESTAPDIAIHVGGDIQLISGNQQGSFATLFLYNPGLKTEILAGGNIRAYNGLHVDATLPMTHGTSDIGDLTIKAGGNIILGGGNMSECPFNTISQHSSKSIYFEADAPFLAGDLWGPLAVATCYSESDPFIIFEAASPAILSDGKGAVAFDTARYSPTIPSSVDGFPEDPTIPNPLFTPISDAVNPVIYHADSDFTLLSSPLYADGSTAADLLIGSNMPVTAHVENRNLLGASAGHNLTISGHANSSSDCVPGMIGGGYRNIALQASSNLTAASGDLLLLAANDVDMFAESSLTAGGNATVVVDNKNPTIFGATYGVLRMDETAHITSGQSGTIRLFLAKRDYIDPFVSPVDHTVVRNQVNGLLNGKLLSETPGYATLFVNNANEIYQSFFCESALPQESDNFTVFYKAGQPPIILRSTARNNPNFELFAYLSSSGTRWEELFESAYEKERESGAVNTLSHFDLPRSKTLQRRYIQRNTLHMYNPKSYTAF